MAAPTEVIGREAELAVADNFLERARAAPAGLLISGPAGIGKTTVWRATSQIAQQRAFSVLETRCAEAEARLPFAGLIDLLDPFAERVLPRLPEAQSAALAVALRRTAPGASEPDPLTVSVSTLGALRQLASTGPLLIAVDDLQWLDPSSRRVLEFVTRRLRAEPIGWLVTVRSSAPRASRSLVSALPETTVDMIDVGPLSLVALERLLRERLGVGFVRPTLLRIERASGGNPFFALELGRALVRRGMQSAPEVLPVPEDVRALLRERLSSLPADAREVVLVAAALADPTRGNVSAALDPSHKATEAIEQAIQAGVLVPQADGERIRFSHPLLASVAYEDASVERRREVHARIARHPGDPEERARHLALSIDGPSERVAQTLEEAAQAARDRGSPEVAAELVELALRCTPARRVDDRRRRGIAGAGYLIQAGDARRARVILEGLLETAPAGVPRSEVLVSLADAYRGDDWAVSTKLLDEAVKHAGESIARIAAERRLASAEFMTLRDVRAGREHARRAVRLAERAGDPAELAGSLLQLAWLEAIVDGTPRHDLLARASELQSSLPSTLVPSLINARALTLAWTGDIAGAREAFLATRAEALRTGDWLALVHPLFELAELELVGGNWKRALELTRETEDVAHQIDNPLIDAHVALGFAEVFAHLGRVDEARPAGERGLALSRKAGSRLIENSAQRILGFLELSLGDMEAAHRLLGRVVAQRLDAGVRNPEVLSALPNEVEALVSLGRVDEAQAILEPFEKQARRLGQPAALAVSARSRGLLLAAAGDPAAAVRSLHEALVHHERDGRPFERGRTLLVLGEVERRNRHRGAARSALGGAATIFEELGARLWAERARKALARIGVPETATGISETDARIIELVVAGHTNRQVAAALFMSPHTVDTHLRRIYRTLGVSSRTELARRSGTVGTPSGADRAG